MMTEKKTMKDRLLKQVLKTPEPSLEDAAEFLKLGGPLPEDYLRTFWTDKVPDLDIKRLSDAVNALIRTANTHPNDNVRDILRQYASYGRKLIDERKMR